MILIHNNNTSKKLQSLFEKDNIINFDYNNEKYKYLDEYISKEIISKLQEKTFDIVFIKDNLSSSYLELIGLRVAYHIRLSPSLKDKKYVKIVILSEVDSYFLNKVSKLARILFTENIGLETNKKATI